MLPAPSTSVADTSFFSLPWSDTNSRNKNLPQGGYYGERQDS